MKLSKAHPLIFGDVPQQLPNNTVTHLGNTPLGSTIFADVQSDDNDEAFVVQFRLAFSKSDLKMAGILFAIYMFWRLGKRGD